MSWRTKRIAIGAALALLLVACAADRRPPPAEPAATATSPAQAQAGYQAQPYPMQPGQPAASGIPGYPAQPGYAPPPPPATPSRQASFDFDKASRELDVAAGDCTIACRALASMDRAAGRICTLSSGTEEDGKRCSEAKERVYSARDKVKNTCNVCSDTSVERRDPIPSTR